MIQELSVITTVYKTRQFLDTLVERIEEVSENYGVKIRIVLVDDRSPDDAWLSIREICRHHPRVSAVRLSRNFGQWTAITAGIRAAPDGPLVVMDSDLEDLPEVIPELIAQLDSADIVVAEASKPPQSIAKGFASRVFYRVWNLLRDQPLRFSRSSFFCLSSRAAQAFRAYPETERSVAEILNHMGFPSKTVLVKSGQRDGGGSSYSFRQRASLAVRAIRGSTTRLLHLGTVLGSLISGASIALGLVLLALSLIGVDFQKGWLSLAILVGLLGGANLLYSGILSLYVETIFWEVKRRPTYHISDTENGEGLRAHDF